MKRSFVAIALCLCVSGLGLPVMADPAATAPAATAEAAPQKVAAPAGDALKQAVSLVTSVFKEDVAAAKTAPQKADLAKKLLAAGREEKDVAGRYAILIMARDFGIESGEIEAVRGAIEELDRGYVVDASKLATDAALATNRNMRTADQRRAMVEWCPDLLEAAVDADRYDVARTIADIFQTAARGVNDAALLKEAATAVQQVRELEGGYNLAKKAMETLNAKPNDPDANAKVGRFRCFYKGQWKEGLPLLAIGNDKTLAALANAEIAGPTEADAQVKIADGWWDAGQSGTSLVKMQTQRHALEWYKTALPRLSGLVKVRVEKRVQEAEATPGMAKKTGGGPAKAEEDLAAKILAKIPKEMLPAKDDAPLDLRTKSSAVQQWMRNNRMVDRNGTTVTMTLPFESCSVFDGGGRDNTQRLAVRFREQTTIKGMDCETMLYVTRAISGTDDPLYKQAKQMEADGKNATYQVTASVTNISINFYKSSSDEQPRVHITLDAYKPGVFSAKAVTKKP